MFVPSLEAARITIDLLDKYDEDEETLEDALKLDYNYVSPEDFLQRHFAQNTYSEEVQDLVAEFFFRISKYRKYFSLIVEESLTSKYSENPKKCEDVSLCIAVLYLLIIELNEFSKSKIEDLLISLNNKKVLQVLTVLKKQNGLSNLFEWGCRIWDIEYVKTVLENHIKHSLFEEVYETVAKSRTSQKKCPTKKLTVAVSPKCLSRPKKKMLLIPKKKEPEEVSRIPIKKPSTIPLSTYSFPLIDKKLEEARENNRMNSLKLLEFAQKKAFKCASKGKSEKFWALKEKIENEKYEVPVRKMTFKKIFKQKPKESFKRTAAVILREGARLLKVEQEEIKRYEYLESGGFNIDLAMEWQEEAREREFEKYMEDIEKKHLEGLLSREEALIARQKYLKKKKERADEFRKERETWLKQLEELRVEEQAKILEMVEKGKSIFRGAKEAIEQVKEEKHKIALETMEHSRMLREKWLREKEEDLQKKVQLIKEIKALQAIGAERIKQATSSETPTLGSLYQMSIAELRERLFIMKIDLREELEKRKAEVKMKREWRKEIIEEYQELIDNHHRIVEEKKKKMEKEVKNNEKKGTKQRSLSLESLRMKLHEKRRERMKHQT